ncbi:hypothetical protein [Streptomyces mayteni]
MPPNIPAHMSEWNGAAEVAGSIDMAALRADSRALVDLVLTDDDVFFDTLSEGVQTSIVSPLEMLETALKEPSDDAEVVAAARIVRNSVDFFSGTDEAAPIEITSLTSRFPEPPTPA